jgi:alpha-beta hydrolase superfamily lysophospholipase
MLFLSSNRDAVGRGRSLAKLNCPDKKLIIIPGATHLFEEPGKLEEVARLSAGWFSQHFRTARKRQLQEASD